MSIDDFMNERLVPDDVEDVREFALAISKEIPEEKMDQLVEHMVAISLRMTLLIENLSTTQMLIPEKSFTLTCLLQLFKFLKRNESAVTKLMRIGAPGEPFLHDI